ncbi:MAG: helix-turn-helix transcriptional regulator [Kiritimatiellaeota bacterium]|nr:helix-turn-helix transcriptional regulator [Kiritimatiellota bacterium]
MNAVRKGSCCPVKPDLKSRPLLTEEQATSLEQTFKVLANGTRLRILHAFCLADEICVSELAKTLGMKPTAVSNQLQRLIHRGVLGYRRNGNRILYRAVDPCVFKLLESAWCLTEDAEVRVQERDGRR